MSDGPLDKIYIRDLLVRCIVGIYPDERREKQDVIINLVMHADLAAAGESDNIDDTVIYTTIKKEVLKMVQESECLLLEKLAKDIADIALTDSLVQRVDVVIDKPGALRFARSVAVEISRTRV
jgi:dihydroneopterin aldolase/D-erythro-7,8-dihydroneopterin triphosphate epimerase